MRPRLNAIALPSILVLLAVYACSARGQPPQAEFDLSLMSDTALTPLVEALVSSYENRNPGTLVTLSTLPRQAVLDSVRAREADAALLFHPPSAREFFSTPVGYSWLVIAARESSPVLSLSRDQLRLLYSGEAGISSIQPIAREPGSSERIAFDALVMGGHQTASTVQLALSPGFMLAIVQSSSDAVGYVAGTTRTTGLTAVMVERVAPSQETVADGRYMLVTQLVFVTLSEPRGAVREFLDWILSPAGQLILQLYAVSLQH